MISFHITELQIICNYIYVYVLIASIKYMLLQEGKGKESERDACMKRIYLGYNNFITHFGATRVGIDCVMKYIKRLLLRCIHHFKSDLINNMDHMRISGNEPSSVILRQTKRFQKLKMLTRKCQNKLKPKGMV